MGWPSPQKEPDLAEVRRLIREGRQHSQIVHGDTKIHDNCPTCLVHARKLHDLSGVGGTFEQHYAAFRQKQREAREAGRPSKIKQSIPREGRIEDVIEEIMQHDRVAHHSDGEVHIDCKMCRQLCKKCLRSIGMTPQDYLDSFELLPDIGAGEGGMRPEILLEIARALIKDEVPRLANPWSYLKELS